MAKLAADVRVYQPDERSGLRRQNVVEPLPPPLVGVPDFFLLPPEIVVVSISDPEYDSKSRATNV